MRSLLREKEERGGGKVRDKAFIWYMYMCVCMDVWIDGCTYGSMDRRMDRWIHVVSYEIGIALLD